MAKPPGLFVTAGDECIALRYTQNGRRETVCQPLPPGAFGDASAMAETLSAVLPARKYLRGSLTLMVNSYRTSIRVARAESAAEASVQDCVRRMFPMGDAFNEATHIFSHTVLAHTDGGCLLFLAALPVTIADSLVGMCVKAGIGLHRIRRIDTVEHRLVRYYPVNQTGRGWMLLPQGPGLRVIAVSDGLPYAVYFTGNDPAYREIELNRPWRAGHPETVVVFTAKLEHDWLGPFFASRNTTVETVDSLEFLYE